MREYGRGSYADTPMRFVSIEKMKEALAQFFDKHLQVSVMATEHECVAMLSCRAERSVSLCACGMPCGRARRVQ